MASPRNEFVAIAQVKILIEVDTGPYGDEWTLDKVYEDAERSAFETIERIRARAPMRISIAGVKTVIVRKKE